MKRAVIIQARMTSTRLPGKVLMDLAGRPMLAQQIRRLREARRVDDIVVATSTLSTDDPVAACAGREGIGAFRGDERDVLKRFAGAAAHVGADLAVRVTGDCPLIDPGEVDRVIQALEDRRGEFDYASNVIERTFPRGLDTEALYRDTLERVERLGRSPEAREHVTWFINRERPELFARHSVKDGENNSDLRWTVDTADDLELIRKIYQALDLGARVAPYREILAVVRARPELAVANAHVIQKDR